MQSPQPTSGILVPETVDKRLTQLARAGEVTGMGLEATST